MGDDLVLRSGQRNQPIAPTLALIVIRVDVISYDTILVHVLDDQRSWESDVKVYGLNEIARALGVDAVLVAKWRERGKLPPADAELANGPVWLARRSSRCLRLADRSGGREAGQAPTGPRTGRPRPVSRPGRRGQAAFRRGDGRRPEPRNRPVRGVAWRGPLQAEVTMGCVAADDAEAFSSVKSMIMRRANNVALVAVAEVEPVSVTRLGDW